ncbi:MAG: hypothetical protein ACK502_07650 [Alphaproteobacteria bacterium]
MQQTIPQIKQSLKDAQTEVRLAGEAKWQEIKAHNPHLSGFEVKTKPYSYKKRPAGFNKVIERLMSEISYPSGMNYDSGVSYTAGADRTQAAIIERIRPSFSNHKILPNVWNRKLTKKQFEKMQGMAWRNFRKPIDIKGCKTLAQVKKRIQAAIHANDATFTFKGTIAIDNKAVIVGKDIYAIETRKSTGHEYPSIRVNIGNKRAWLRVDLLRLILPCNMIIAENKASKTALKTS